MNESDPIITIKGLSKKFKNGESDLKVLNQIDLSIKSGGILSISGESGCGKSTLLGLLAGLDEPTEGSINVDGYPVDTLSEQELTGFRKEVIGIVFQFHYLLKDFTALENVAVPAYLSGASWKDASQRSKNLLNRVGLSQRLNHYPSQLSGGERQRTALGRCLVNNPKVILADEPTGNLDQTNSVMVQKLLTDLAVEKGTTLIYVTHDPEFASMAPQQMRLEQGSLVVQR